MSRGIRDLRDLICVSRLTVRHSDEEIFSSDDDGDLTDKLSHSSLSSTDPSRESSATSRKALQSPDSGIATNGNSPQDSAENVNPVKSQTLEKAAVVPHPPQNSNESAVPRAFKKKKKKKRKPLEPVYHDLPKMAPLPPVSSFSHSRPFSSSSESTRSELMSPGHNVIARSSVIKGANFDELLTYLDATVVAEWLLLSNKNVTDLATWIHAGENFVHFAHFWLSQFPDSQKHEIFKLEYSILIDNLNFAFAAARDSGQVKRRDLTDFLKAVFREYPEKLLSMKGNFLFLDHLEVLSCERHESYKVLLSDVKCSTRNKQHAQWILAVRAFTLVSVWMSVLNFHRKVLTAQQGSPAQAPPVPLDSISKNNPNQLRMYQAIRNGYTDVAQYLVKTGKVDPLCKDKQKRNWIFTSVMLNQPKVLSFILEHFKPCPSVNEATGTGNTALHAAANSGNTEVVEILLRAKGIDVNPRNSQCDGATPLHVAVMHGHVNVVEQLLKAGADLTLLMGDLNAVTIATDFEHHQIVELIQKYMDTSPQSKAPIDDI